jgi:tRNA (guanine-N(7)-)-methyltransferase subunit TRM82
VEAMSCQKLVVKSTDCERLEKVNMPLKHPFHIVLSNNQGDVLFTAAKNQIQVFSAKDGSRLGSWVDDIDTTVTLKEKIKKEQERQIQENGESAKKKRKSNNSEPKLPTPGAGAPTVYNHVRALQLTKDEQYMICATDSDKAGIIFRLDFNKENCLELLKRQPFPKRPSAITSTTDGKTVLLGDKFGDVYKIPVDNCEPTEVNSETDPVLGHVSMLTDLTLVSHEDQEFLITCDRDEHIRVSHYPQGFVIKSFLFGHEQFVNTLLVPGFQQNVLISGGGDDFICSWDWVKGEQLDKFDIRSLVDSQLDDSHFAPSKFQNEQGDLKEITISQLIELPNAIGVLVEATKCVLILKLRDGKLSLEKIVQLQDKVISITSSGDKIIASVENDTELLQSIDLTTLELAQSEALDKISHNSSVEIESREQLFPLYNAYQLRKRSEH